MTGTRTIWQALIAIVAITAVALTPRTPASAQDNGKREDGQGKYAQLTAQCWQWILEQPATGNPNFDSTGADAANGQPREDVFFLAGTFAGTETRSFSVPAGTPLFLPLINNLAFAVPTPPGPRPKDNFNQVPQLRTLLAAPLIDAVTELHVTLNGVSLLGSVTRAKSPVFRFTLPDEDNVFQAFGVDLTGTFMAVSDGYWLFIPPLPAGVHVLNFGATSGGFTVDITDTITVE